MSANSRQSSPSNSKASTPCNSPNLSVKMMRKKFKKMFFKNVTNCDSDHNSNPDDFTLLIPNLTDPDGRSKSVPNSPDPDLLTPKFNKKLDFGLILHKFEKLSHNNDSSLMGSFNSLPTPSPSYAGAKKKFRFGCHLPNSSGGNDPIYSAIPNFSLDLEVLIYDIVKGLVQGRNL